MPLAYILFDADLRITDWNPEAERIFGYAKADALGMEPFDLCPESFRQEATEILDRIREGDMTSHSVNENLTKDGRTITCEWFNTPLTSEGGQFVGLLCLAQDITARREAEAALRLRDRAIQAVTQGILITDPWQRDNPIIYASSSFERLTGYTSRRQWAETADSCRARTPIPGTESILLVEDEAGLRGLLHQVLNDCGYNVSTAASGIKALQFAQEHSGTFDLIVTDVVMPGMSGRQNG